MSLQGTNALPTLEGSHYFLFNKSFDADSTGAAIRFIIERNLMTDERPQALKLIINSPGGSVYDAFALIDTIKGSKIPVYTYGLGQISSAGLMTFIAGARGHRYITPNTSILSHQYSASSFGKEHELMATVKKFNHVGDMIRRHYSKCTGLKAKQIDQYLLPPQDVWLTAEEAVKFHLADEIVKFY